MTARDVDIFGWSETNIEWNDFLLNNTLYKHFQREFPGGKWIPATSKSPFKTTYKPGGVLLGATRWINSQVELTGKDPLGRWSWMVFRGQPSSILVVQLYIPPFDQTGLFTTAVQQWEQLRTSQQPNPSVRKAYFKHLHQFLCKHADKETIIMGDFNLPPDNPNIADLRAEHDLRDVYSHIHHDTVFNTHKEGSQRIDYALATPTILKHIVRMGYEGINSGIQSDHRGLFLDLDRKIITNTAPVYKRKLDSRRSNRTKAYRERFYTSLINKNNLNRIQILVEQSENKEWNKKSERHIQQADRDITASMISAKTKRTPAHNSPWNPTTHRVNLELNCINAELAKKCPKLETVHNRRFPPKTWMQKYTNDSGTSGSPDNSNVRLSRGHDRKATQIVLSILTIWQRLRNSKEQQTRPT